MNKGITLLILGVVLFAMGLVFYSHLDSTSTPVTTEPIATSGDDSTEPLVTANPGATEAVPTVVAGSGRVPAESSEPINLSPAVAPAASSATQAGQQSTQQSGQQSGQLAGTQTAPAAGGTQPPYSAPTLKPLSDEQQTQAGQKPATAPADTQASTKPATQAKKQPTATEKAPQETADAPAAKPARTSLTPLERLPKDGKHTLQSMGLHFSGNTIFLRIEADSAFPFKSFALSGPDRLVVDLLGTWHGVTTPTVPSNQVVTKVRVGQQTAGPRIVLDLSRKVTVKVNRVSDTVVELMLE